jgi:hypothetical protein
MENFSGNYEHNSRGNLGVDNDWQQKEAHTMVE